MSHHVLPPAAQRFRELYRAELGYVWRTLRRLGVPGADVEDLAHDVFVIVHRKLDQYDPTRPLRPWLFGIAFRVAAGHRRLHRTAREVPMAEPEAEAEVSAEGEARVEAAERRALVLAALAEIDLDQRAVLVLHDIDGCPVPEIAQALDVKLNTVYSRLRLAREKFAAAVSRLRAERGAA
jgi:RNA polymerase sigma-70 factor (ECF subfamily)